MPKEWPCRLPAVQFRITHPSDNLERVTTFYRDGLGLPVIFSYMDDAEYDGVMFGLPSRQYNLEITRHKDDGPCPQPSPDALLVFYLLDKTAIMEATERLALLGYHPVTPRNSYWATQGVTFADPDGWHFVLMNTPGFGEDVE